MKKKENQRIALTKRLLKESLLRLMSEKNIQNNQRNLSHDPAVASGGSAHDAEGDG